MEWKIKRFDELTPGEVYEILRSRAEVFVSEQRICCTDPDGVDYDCYHVFGEENGRVAAYLRAYIQSPGTLKVGRVLTLEHGRGLGRELMLFALRELKELTGCSRVHIDAQKYAAPFYRKFGFEVTSGDYIEEGIVHVDMDLYFQER